MARATGARIGAMSDGGFSAGRDTLPKTMPSPVLEQVGCYNLSDARPDRGSECDREHGLSDARLRVATAGGVSGRCGVYPVCPTDSFGRAPFCRRSTTPR
jgi:hypothetical protein